MVSDSGPEVAAGSGRVAQLWWVDLVVGARRLSGWLAGVLADGLYLVTWPAVGAVAPPLAVLVGLVVGARHPGFETVFSESLLLVVLMVTLGTLSGHLGLAFLAGYAAGDFFLFDRATRLPAGLVRGIDGDTLLGMAQLFVQDLLRIRLPLLIQYGLMALPLTTFPLLTKTLLRSLTILPRLGGQVSVVAAAAVHGALTFAQVYFWTQSVPLLIRPLFTWRNAAIPADAVSPLQQYGLALAAGAVVASVVRMALQGMTAYLPRFREPVDRAEARLGAAPPATPLTWRIPRLLRALGGALATTLLLGGLYATWLDGVGLFLLVLLLQAIRLRLLPVPLGPWPRLVERIPLALRVGAAALLLLYLANTTAATVRGAETFRPLVVLAGLAMLVGFILNPVSPIAPQPPSPDAPPGSPGPAARARPEGTPGGAARGAA